MAWSFVQFLSGELVCDISQKSLQLCFLFCFHHSSANNSIAWAASTHAVKLNTRNCSFLKPDPEWLKGFNGLQIWDHTRVWEKLSQTLMSWSPLRGMRAVSPLSAQFHVVAGGRFDSWWVLPADSFLPPLLILHSIYSHWLARRNSAPEGLKLVKSFSKQLPKSYISDIIWWRTLEVQILMIYFAFSEAKAL